MGALFILVIRSDDPKVVARNARNVALLTSLATFVVSLLILTVFDPHKAEFQLVEQAGLAAAMPASTPSIIRWASTAFRCGSCCCRPS